MTWTTSIILNAVLSVLVVVALFRLMWFGISARYGEPSSRGGRQLRQETLEDERSQQAA